MRVVPLFMQFILAQLPGGLPPRRQMTAKVRRIKMRRLEELEAQAATYGISAPPEITNEIDDLRDELEIVDNLERGKLDPPMQELLSRYDTGDQLIAFFRAQASKIRQLEQSVYDLADSFEQWKEKRQQQSEEEAKQREKDAKELALQQQRERTIGGMLTGAVLVMLGLLLILVLFMLFTR